MSNDIVDENSVVRNMEGGGNNFNEGILSGQKRRKSNPEGSTNMPIVGNKKSRNSLAKRYSDHGEGEEGDETEEDADLDTEDDVGAENFDTVLEEEEDVNTSKKVGGIIQSIYVENFMNHKKMEVTLNPTLTFITGKNGSGKSAIATALMICLGSRASTTGRGNSLSDLVMQGCNGSAKVRVSLKNTGSDAYQPHLYGKTIVVERTISRSGGSTLALKNGAKLSNTISTKRADLDRILTKFDIRVDNPCCVLTQENSKKFIKGKEEDKYDFFMKATGLKPMWDELKDLQETFVASKVAYDKAQGVVDRLKEDYAAKKKDLTNMLEFHNMERQICELHAKALWIDVFLQRDVLCRIKEACDEAEESAKKAKDRLADEEKASNNAGEKKAQLMAALEEADAAVQELDESAEGTNEEYMTINKRKNELKKLEKEANIKIRGWEEKKVEYMDELEEIQQKAMGNADEKELFNRKEQIQAEIKKTENDIQECSVEQDVEEEHLRDLKKQMKLFDAEANSLSNELRSLEKQFHSIRSSDKQGELIKFSAISPRFGSELHNVYKDIQNDPKLKRDLVGPIGHLLGLKPDAQKCAPAVHIALTGLENTFINIRKDLDVMHRGQDLFKKHGFRAMIVNQPGYGGGRYEVPTMDYNDKNFSLIDALTINHEDPKVCDLIFNVLIDRKRAHTVLIVPTEESVKDYICFDKNGKNVFKNKTHKSCITMEAPYATVTLNGGNRAFSPWKRPPLKYLSTSSTDSADTVKEMQQAIETKKAEIEEHQSNTPSSISEKALQKIKAKIKTHDNCLRTLKKDLKVVEREIAEMEDVGDSTDLQGHLDEAKHNIDRLESERDRIKGEIKTTDIRHAELKKAVEAMDARKEELGAIRDSKEEELVKEVERSRKTVERLSQFRRAADNKAISAEKAKATLADQQSQYMKLETDVKAQTRELMGEAWDGKELQPGANDTKEKLKKRAQKRKEDMEKQKEANAVSGLTLEIASERKEASKAAYNEAKRNINILYEQLEKLSADLKDRKSAFKSHRLTCSDRVDKQFTGYLLKKNFSGKVYFEHADEHTRGKLYMNVNKDGGEVEDGCADIRNLSGGERSFVTLSLLLALGHVVDAPFRLMDEYDVFLDEFSRTVTLNEIQDYAKNVRTGKKQYIVITPNSLRGITTGVSTKVFKMPDPQRRSATGLQQSTID